MRCQFYHLNCIEKLQTGTICCTFTLFFFSFKRPAVWFDVSLIHCPNIFKIRFFKTWDWITYMTPPAISISWGWDSISKMESDENCSPAELNFLNEGLKLAPVVLELQPTRLREATYVRNGAQTGPNCRCPVSTHPNDSVTAVMAH